jgi:hypothetical protein
VATILFGAGLDTVDLPAGFARETVNFGLPPTTANGIAHSRITALN